MKVSENLYSPVKPVPRVKPTDKTNKPQDDKKE